MYTRDESDYRKPARLPIKLRVNLYSIRVTGEIGMKKIKSAGGCAVKTSARRSWQASSVNIPDMYRGEYKHQRRTYQART